MLGHLVYGRYTVAEDFAGTPPASARAARMLPWLRNVGSMPAQLMRLAGHRPLLGHRVA